MSSLSVHSVLITVLKTHCCSTDRPEVEHEISSKFVTEPSTP